MKKNRALSGAMGVLAGVVAGTTLILLAYPTVPWVFLSGAVIAGGLGCMIAGWKDRWALAGSVLGVGLITAVLYAGLAYGVWTEGDLGVESVVLASAVLILAYVGLAVVGKWVRDRFTNTGWAAGNAR